MIGAKRPLRGSASDDSIVQPPSQSRVVGGFPRAGEIVPHLQDGNQPARHDHEMEIETYCQPAELGRELLKGIEYVKLPGELQNFLCMKRKKNKNEVHISKAVPIEAKK